jgi:hypothetical protein
MGAILGILILGALAWLIYAGRVKVIASRRYNWNRNAAPDIKGFANSPQSLTADRSSEPSGEWAAGGPHGPDGKRP